MNRVIKLNETELNPVEQNPSSGFRNITPMFVLIDGTTMLQDYV